MVSTQRKKEKRLRTSFRSIRALLASSLAVIGLLVLGAGSAFASNWVSGSGQVQGQGSMTLELNGAKPVHCPNVEFTGLVGGSPGVFLFNPSGADFYGHCEVPSWIVGNPVLYISLTTPLYGTATKEGHAMTGGLDGFAQGSPYGSFTSYPWSVPFVDAAGGQTSSFTFSQTKIGVLSGVAGSPVLSATGTFHISDGKGGNVTLIG
jgi:hypothetical protein